MPAAKIRTNFFALLKEAALDKEIGITFSRKKETIAVIVPIEEYKSIKMRKLDTLEGKVTIEFSENWAIINEEFLMYENPIRYTFRT